MKKFLMFFTIFILSILLVGCSPQEVYDDYAHVILGYSFSGNCVMFDCGSEIIKFYPDSLTTVYREETYEVKLFKINDKNKIYLFPMSMPEDNNIYLKNSDIEKIYKQFNLNIPENIEILGQESNNKENNNSSQESSNSNLGLVLLIILVGVATIIGAVLSINKIKENVIHIEEGSYNSYQPYFYIKTDENEVSIHFNVKELDKRYVVTIPKEKATRKKIQKIKAKVTKVIDKATELKNYLSAVESAYNELNKN